jgi:LysR family hydrogen peroxide-inducible transcriptional activator
LAINPRVPTVAQLRAFAALAEKLHFRDAAAELGMSQPALSGAVAALEETLGTRLVERTTRHVLLTRSGEEVARRARAVLDGVEELTEAAQATGRPFTGDLHLGVIPTVAPYLLPALLRPLKRRYPELELVLHEERTASIVDGLAAGRLDLAVLATPVDGPNLAIVPLYEEDFMLVFPGDDPRATPGPVPLAALGDLPVLVMEEGHCLRDQTLEVCHEAGGEGLASTRAASLATLVQLVAGGLGVTLLPRTAAAVEARPGSGLTAAAFHDPAPGRGIALVHRASSPRAREFGALAGTIREAVRAQGLPVRIPEPV